MSVSVVVVAIIYSDVMVSWLGRRIHRQEVALPLLASSLSRNDPRQVVCSCASVITAV